MTKYTDITKYFKNIANIYLGNSQTNKTFFRKGLDEFLNHIDIVCKTPVMLLERYDFRYTDNMGDNVLKDRTIAFIIMNNVADIDDYEALDTVFDECETIIDKIFNHLRKDATPPRHNIMKYSNFNNFDVTPIENQADGNFGYFVTVKISSVHSTKIL